MGWGWLKIRPYSPILKAMKTCFLNNLYPPYAVGGAERVVFARAKAMVERGEEAVVITTAPWQGWGSWRPIKTVEEGIVVYRFWVPHMCWYRDLQKHSLLFKLLWHKIDVWNWQAGLIVKNILQTERPDIAETHNLMGLGFSIPGVIQRLHIRHVHYLHDVQLVEPSGVLPWNHEYDSLFQKLYAWVMRMRMETPTKVIFPSNFLREFYEKRGFWSESEIWSGESGMGNHEVRIMNHEVNSKRFLFVGSLVVHKGVQLLLDAWKTLPKELNIHLDIVGDGPLRSLVETFAKEDSRVTYHGRLEGEALHALYRKNDVLVFPSVCLENRPTVIVEALEHGMQVIASDTGGVKELITQTLILPGDTVALAEAIRLTLRV